MQSVGAAGDDTSLTVEALGAGIGDAGVDIGEHAIQVLADGARDPDERGELGARRPREPAHELVAGNVVLPAAEDRDERILEQVGAIEWLVRGLDVGDLAALETGETIRMSPRVSLWSRRGLSRSCARWYLGELSAPSTLSSRQPVRNAR